MKRPGFCYRSLNAVLLTLGSCSASALPQPQTPSTQGASPNSGKPAAAGKPSPRPGQPGDAAVSAPGSQPAQTKATDDG